ncbi:hypothetical protein V8C26DRAFT_401413 [Trichoderma gracile]
MALSKPILLLALSAALFSTIFSSVSSPLLTRHRLLTIIAFAIALLIFASASHHSSPHFKLPH